MAQLTVTVPEDQLQRVLDAFAATYGYRDEVPADPPAPDPNAPASDPMTPPGSAGPVGTKPNPEDRRAFTKRMMREHVLAVVRSHEAGQAASKAQDAAAKKVDGELGLG